MGVCVVSKMFIYKNSKIKKKHLIRNFPLRDSNTFYYFGCVEVRSTWEQ